MFLARQRLWALAWRVAGETLGPAAKGSTREEREDAGLCWRRVRWGGRDQCLLPKTEPRQKGVSWGGSPRHTGGRHLCPAGHTGLPHIQVIIHSSSFSNETMPWGRVATTPTEEQAEPAALGPCTYQSQTHPPLPRGVGYQLCEEETGKLCPEWQVSGRLATLLQGCLFQMTHTGMFPVRPARPALPSALLTFPSAGGRSSGEHPGKVQEGPTLVLAASN